jgi:hypothetical protein
LPGLGFFLSSPFSPFLSSLSSASTLQPGGTEPGPKITGNVGAALKVLAGGSFPVNGTPFAFCAAGVLLELPWAKAKQGAATANAANAAKVLSMESTPQWLLKLEHFVPIFATTAQMNVRH